MIENSPNPKAEKPWLTSLLAALPHGVAFVDASWKIIWANQEFWESIGSSEKKENVCLGDLINVWSKIEGGILYALKEKKVKRVREVVEFNASGIQKRMEICIARCHPDLDATWSLSLTDVSEEEHLRQELEDRRQSYSFIRGFTSDLIIRTDKELLISWCNHAAEDIFKINEQLSTFVEKDSLKILEDLIHNDDATTEGSKIGLKVNKKNGMNYYLSGLCRKLFDESSEFMGLSIILHDDSDQKRFDELVERLSMSPREKEITEYLMQGYSNLNIATILGLSESGVKFHIRNVFGRAKVNTRTEFMAMMLQS